MIGFSISWKLFLEIRVKSGSLVWDCLGRGRDLVECVLFIRSFELVGGYDLFALVVVRFSMFSSLSESISEIERRRFCVRDPVSDWGEQSQVVFAERRRSFEGIKVFFLGDFKVARLGFSAGVVIYFYCSCPLFLVSRH